VVFILAGIIGLTMTLLAYKSRYYTLLSKSYLDKKNEDADTNIVLPHPTEAGIN
jgi:hypothetical protein